MAALCGRMCIGFGRNTLGLSCVKNVRHNLTLSRTLFSHEILGLDSYKRQKSILEDRLGDLKESFMEKMEEYLASTARNTIFTDDLKTVAYVASNDTDVSTLVSMIKKYHQQNSEIRFGVFHFGPIVMRLLYSLDKPQMALELFKDHDLDGFFDQMSAFLVLLDLLYEHGMYKEVLEAFDIVKNRQLLGFRYPNDCTTLALAACYKLNTAESFEWAKRIISGAQEMGSNLSQRSICYVALLALSQNQPEAALELVSIRPEKKVGIVSNIQALTYLELNRVDDAILCLKGALHQDVPSHFTTGNEIFQATLDKVKSAVEKLSDATRRKKFELLERALVEGGHVSTRDLEQFVCMTITRPRRQNQHSYKSRYRPPPQASFSRARTDRRGIMDGE